MKKLLSTVLALSLVLGSTLTYSKVKASDEEVKIGIIQYMDHVSLDAARKGFEDYIKSENINAKIDVENENGDTSLVNTVPEKFKDYDLVYTIGTPAAQGAQNVLKEKPIVFSAVTDPVDAKLVKSLKDPQTGITGVTDYVDPGKQIDDFLKVYPDIKTFGVVYSTNEQNSLVQVKALEKALEERNLKLVKKGITSTNDVSQALTSISSKIDALFTISDNLVASSAPIVAKTLGEKKIPQLSSEEGQVKKGLLMSQGINYYEQGKEAGKLAKEILVDKKDPKEIAVVEGKPESLIVNTDMAKTLNLDLNQDFFKNAEKITTEN
ncbi:MAG: ABC transporter substrate-binding protein [Peptoniphilaceae bacterium]|nr:ABC transporter substrate-binding protein [Peptoniphilaceae bacterium]MDD7383206.1 ABC transporter substrate-binding protein [Peptoniphilaceae bacterium]MDY3738430.1 ABC transporter substrate-binding protein [Peptoniphilaceae bacterium]